MHSKAIGGQDDSGGSDLNSRRLELGFLFSFFQMSSIQDSVSGLDSMAWVARWSLLIVWVASLVVTDCTDDPGCDYLAAS